MSTFWLLSVVVALCAFVQGSVGVGFAMILAPVLAYAAPGMVPVSLLALMIPLNAYVAWGERSALDWRGVGWISVARFIGTFGGVWILGSLSVHALGIVIGATTILASIATIAAPSFEPGPQAFLLAGLVTGISETATGIGGPPLALVYQHRAGAVLRATIALCFLVGEILSLVLLAIAGRASQAALVSALTLLPALVVGALASRAMQRRVQGRFLRACVLVFAIASGTLLILRPAS